MPFSLAGAALPVMLPQVVPGATPQGALTAGIPGSRSAESSGAATAPPIQAGVLQAGIPPAAAGRLLEDLKTAARTAPTESGVISRLEAAKPEHGAALAAEKSENEPATPAVVLPAGTAEDPEALLAPLLNPEPERRVQRLPAAGPSAAESAPATGAMPRLSLSSQPTAAAPPARESVAEGIPQAGMPASRSTSGVAGIGVASIGKNDAAPANAAEGHRIQEINDAHTISAQQGQGTILAFAARLTKLAEPDTAATAPRARQTQAAADASSQAAADGAAETAAPAGKSSSPAVSPSQPVVTEQAKPPRGDGPESKQREPDTARQERTDQRAAQPAQPAQSKFDTAFLAATPDAAKPQWRAPQKAQEAAGSQPSQPPASDPHPSPLAPRDISLRLRAAETSVDVQFVERQGQVHVSVHTPDGELATALRQDLGSLVDHLQHTGYQAETWTPASPAAGAGTAEPAAGRDDGGRNPNSDSSGGGWQGGSQGHSQNQEGRQQPDQESQSRWFDQLAASVPTSAGRWGSPNQSTQ